MSDQPNSLEDRAYAQRTSGVDAAAERARLEKLAPWYAKFLEPWLPADRRAPMADVPCGAGNLLFALRSLGYEGVHGLDSDEGQVRMARELGLPAERGDALAFIEACAPASLARIFSLDFVEHLGAEEAVRFCSDARRALAPGGILLLRTPSADGPFGAHDRYNDLTHRTAFTASSGTQLLQLAGFARGSVEIVQEAPVPYRLRNALRRAAFEVTTRALGVWLTFCGIGPPAVWTRSMWIVGRTY